MGMGAFVLLHDLRQKGCRQIEPIIVRRAARDDRRGIGDQFANDPDRLGRGRDDDARIVPKPQPEHQHVPGFRVPPGSNLVAPSCVMLRTAQALGLVRAVSRGNCAVRPC